MQLVADPGEPVDPLIGLTVGGKYHIQQLLGRGGMGDVYKAIHLTLDRPVVLKLLKKLFLSEQSVVQRFHREARAASRLNHPNSITIIDFGQTDDGTLFMAMEYLPGRSLAQVIAEEHPLAEDRVVHVGAQILAALAEAHSLGIIHRDLKPANVMIESRLDEKDFVKVLDFGIAKLSESGTTRTGITQAGIVCGTPGYMSPEQACGEELDARSDLYAVGVILYEMITGLLPFAALTPMGLVTSHLVEDPTPICVRNPRASVSPQLETLIMRALARRREERFTSSGEMRAALLSCAPAAGAGQSAGSAPRPPSTILFDPAQRRREAAKPERRPGESEEFRFADMSEAGAERDPAAETPGVGDGSQEDVARHASASVATPDTPVSLPDPVVPSRRRATFVGIAIALVIALVASWGLASGRLRMKARSPEAPSKAEPDHGVAVQRNDTSPTVASASAQVQPDAHAKPPEADAEEPGPVVPPQAVAPAPGPTPHPSVLRSPKPKKGVKQVGGRLNSIRTPPASSGEGVLTVMASPWAIVSVDGRDIGETPREVRLGAGRYLVRAAHPALGARERFISVKPGKRQVWSPSFGK